MGKTLTHEMTGKVLFALWISLQIALVLGVVALVTEPGNRLLWVPLVAYGLGGSWGVFRGWQGTIDWGWDWWWK
jgi:hypothetical protein